MLASMHQTVDYGRWVGETESVSKNVEEYDKYEYGTRIR